MPSAATEVVLFVSSFAPLWALFGLLNSFGRGLPSIACFVVAGASTLGLIGFMKVVQLQQDVQIRVSSATARDQDTIGYVVTYLLPFVALGSADWSERVAMLVFIALVAILYIRASLFYVNPLLALVRYRLFEGDLGTGHSVIIITRRRYIAPDSTLQLKTITESVYVEASGARRSRAGRRSRQDVS